MGFNELKSIVEKMEAYIRDQRNVHNQIKCRVSELLTLIGEIDKQRENSDRARCCCVRGAAVMVCEAATSPGQGRPSKTDNTCAKGNGAATTMELPSRRVPS